MLRFLMIFIFKTKNLLAGVAVFANIPWWDFRSAYTHVLSRCHRSAPVTDGASQKNE
jgi:hypothetical protein